MEKVRKSILINFTNHPSQMWGKEQKEAASHYGKVIDIPFPQVDGNASESYIEELASKYVAQILEVNPVAVVCQGEFCLTYQVVKLLKERDMKVLAACSKRETKETVNDNGVSEKNAIFHFVRFREYT